MEQYKDANYFIHKRLHEEKLPYWDAANMLRTPDICDVSSDGLHVKLWVDIMRARQLLNFLCDDDWNWIGRADAFL